MAFAKTTRASLLSLALSLLSSTTIAAPNLAFESDWGIRAAVARNEINVTASEASGHVSESRWPSGLSFGVDYYPSQWAESMWDSDAQRMANGSISYVRIGEFDWAVIEPVEGEYNWDLFDRSISTLGDQGLKVILGTPTATPPIWAVEKYDILPQDASRRDRRFGSRRHYSFSSPDYRMLSRRITTAMAKRYGHSQHVAGWQLDNEFGCHDTVHNFDKHARSNFDKWLEHKYDSNITKLNEAWGNVFWSQKYQNFKQIDVPSLTVTESNPAHRFEYMHFTSDEVVTFAKEQADIIRKYAKKDAFITTNFMGLFWDFDHFKLAREAGLDLATWDNYPLGQLDSNAFFSDADKARYARTGHPDLQSFHHALYRAVGGAGLGKALGPWGIMEQQPGPVNWAPHNPSPAAGQIRLWSHEVFAGSGDMVNYFRWREVPFAQEQMHAALLRRDDVPDVAFEEQQRIVNSDLPKLRDAGLLTDAEGLGHADQAPIAMVIDYSAPWALAANPQSGSWDLADGSAMFTGNVINWTGYILNWYTALRRLALSVDIVEAGADLSGYKLVLVPTMPKVNITFDVALQAYNGSFIAGIRTASKEQVISIPEGLPPAAGAVRDRLPIKVVRVESLAANLGDQVSFNGVDYNTTNWSEWLECARDGKNASMPAEATYKGYREGKPATCAHKDENGKMSRYIGFDSGTDFLMAYFANAASEAGIQTLSGGDPSTDSLLDQDIRMMRNGPSLFVFNYGPVEHQVEVPQGATLVVGGVEGDAARIERSGVNIYKLAA